MTQLSDPSHGPTASPVSGEPVDRGSVDSGINTFAPLLLALSILFVFAPTVGVYFSQDDFSFLNRAQQATIGQLIAEFANLGGGFYRPLIGVYFAILYRFLGLNALAFHVVGASILMIDAWLVVLTTRRLGVDSRGSVAAGIFYGCNAALTALVMWSAAASSLLAVFWALLTVLLLTPPVGIKRGVAGIITFAISLTSRETVAIVPILVSLVHLYHHFTLTRTRSSAVGAQLSRFWPVVALWAVLGSFLIARASSLAGMAADSPYRQDLGPHILSNVLALMAHATGVSTAVHILLGDQLKSSYQALFWFAVGLGCILLLTRRRVGGIFGLTWFAVGILPVIFLSRHQMDAYYLDIALVGLAIAIGALVQAFLSTRRSRIVTHSLAIAAFIAYVGLSFASVGNGLRQSPIVGQALRAESAISDIRRAYPDLPRGATLYLEGTDDVTNWALGFGDLFRVVYRDPSLKVLIGSTGDVLQSGDQHISNIFVLRSGNGRLIAPPPMISQYPQTPRGHRQVDKPALFSPV